MSERGHDTNERPSVHANPYTRLNWYQQREEELETKLAATEVQRDAALTACREIVARYDELWSRMDADHAAFFTGLGTEVASARAAIAGPAKPPCTAESRDGGS